MVEPMKARDVTPTSPAASVERLLDEAWTVDCAIRLHQPAWAAALAEHLAADLRAYRRQIEASWHPVDPDIGQCLAREIRLVRIAVLAAAQELRRGATWPEADVYVQVERLISREAAAVADLDWDLD
jgi:hypothetical protein